ncbi:MAG: phytanoyl-CoA dioxygenase family protein [Hydrogenophaga sp.]|uniref:phytanoyl-CoA dioxygenase family protein n=1 Tax=Hydrogenophaga sp. TaxID=1904254 RepID=UPI001DD012DF|nr:phytanoyl-CoA dioxygenase family protein [Hydrogenophaga sp.]MBX3611691.1 phytanoyl-CoA dioxygenase family protein [Hydrogenophaga sp.]
MSPADAAVPLARYGVLDQATDADALSSAAAQLRRVGYCVIDAGLSAAELGELSAAFDRLHERYLAVHGAARMAAIDEHNTIRAPLLQGEPWFVRLASWPRMLALVGQLITGRFILNQQNGVINPSGQAYNQGAWHRDLPYQHFVADRPIAVNALFCLDEFRADNGATWVLPGSHTQAAFASDADLKQHAVQVSAPAGAFIVLDAMTFHCGGVNHSPRARRAINHVYAIPHIRQQIGLSAGFAGDGSLSAQQRSLFGLGTEEPRSIDEYLARRGLQ